MDNERQQREDEHDELKRAFEQSMFEGTPQREVRSRKKKGRRSSDKLRSCNVKETRRLVEMRA